MKKTILLPVAALALMTLVYYGATQIKADEVKGQHPLVSFIAQRFGLNESDVLQAVEEFHDQEREDMEVRFEEKLDQAVAEGKITEEQKEKILLKHEEMRAEMENDFANLKEMTPEERKEEIMNRHEELKTWAEENDIDLSYFHFKFGMGKGMGMGQHVRIMRDF